MADIRGHGRVIAALAWPIVVAALAAPSAMANDAYTTLGAGGLILSKTEDVAMVREDLEIALDRIAVRYVFRNRSSKDVHATVGFPLPRVPGGLLKYSPVDLPQDGGTNFVGFTARVDGTEVATSLQEKAFLDGRDVTAEVRGLGFSPNHFVPVPGGANARGAIEAGLIFSEEDNAPLWDFEATYHWDQTFPAGRDVVVEHAYRPVAGSGGREGFCVDKATAAGIDRLWKGNGTGEHYASRDVQYVLMSARTWAGPIDVFHLTIRKDRPETIVSTCLEGLRKTGATTFEMTRRNFVPDRDLHVLFVNAVAVGDR